MLEVQQGNASAASFAANAPVYLRPNVTLEPLVCGWHAWPHLLSPVQAAMNMAFRYLPLLQSFVTTPMIHVSATRDPKLFGGPFVHLPLSDVPKVKELIATTKTRFAPLLKLAEELKAFDASLQESCKGFCMNEIYSRLPPSLMGMVELMYDVNNHPRIYLIEELLYTEYESVLRQHMTLSLSTTPESQRRFFMSTPRIQSADTVTLQRDFSDPRLDHLTSMRLEPMPLNELEEKLQIPGLAGRLQPFVTTEVPTRREPDYNGDGVRVRYFGHACVMLQTAEVTILVDPMFAAEPLPGDAPSSCSRLTIHDVPDKIDYLVFSHCHQDHFSVEVLLQLRTRIRKVVVPLNNRGSITDPSMKLILAQMGILDVLSLGYFDSVEFEGGRLTAVPFPGEHSDLEVYSKQSLLFEINGRKLLFLVDSDCWDMALYQRIARRVLNGNDPVEALFLGMECQGAPLSWQYGPLLTRPLTRRDDESRRLSGSNFARASNIVQQFNCRRVYVYAMGQEPWMRYLMGLEYAPDNIQISESNKLIEHCRAQGKISERLYGSQDLLL